MRKACPKKLNEDPSSQRSNCHLCRTGFFKLSNYRIHLNSAECKRRTERLLQVFTTATQPVNLDFYQADPYRSLIRFHRAQQQLQHVRPETRPLTDIYDLTVNVRNPSVGICNPPL